MGHWNVSLGCDMSARCYEVVVLERLVLIWGLKVVEGSARVFEEPVPVVSLLVVESSFCRLCLDCKTCFDGYVLTGVLDAEVTGEKEPAATTAEGHV